MLERANVAAGFDLTLQEDPYQPTDVATFNQAGVPSLNFTTGAHVDYHKPSDTADKINYEDLDRIVDLAAVIIRAVADADAPPAFTKVDQPTDVASFNQAGVACLTFFTSTHVDYHRPTDTAEKVNYEDLDRIVSFAAAIVKRIGDAPEAPQFTKVEQQTETTAGRAGIRLFTGTIPDYATNVKGLLLGGVIGGGPAEQSGLQKGDVIIEIGGQTIANIYDYTYALDVLKIGEPAKVVYLRNGERKETMLTPGARK